MPEKFTLYLVLNVLAIIRIILCLFPQNHWFSKDRETKWGLYRNIPFAIMGVITVLYLIIWYREWLLAVLVTLSFVCYMIVVLGARKKPMLGMMMIPKTICYIWMIALFLK
jgi:peptidoglycan/LPS O-acetylase OafA/YrhL